MRRTYIFIFYFLCHSTIAQQVDISWIGSQLQKVKELSERNQLNLSNDKAQQLIRQIDNSKVDFPAQRIHLYHLVGDNYLELGNFDFAFANYEKARTVLQVELTDSLVLKAENLNKLGNYYLDIKDLENASELFYEALEIRQAELDETDLRDADIYNNIGACMDLMGDFDKAIEYHNQALKIRWEQLPNPHSLIGQSFMNIGLNLLSMESHVDAYEYLNRAVRQYENYYQTSHPDLGKAYLNMGKLFGDLGMVEEFKDYNEKALAIWQNTLPKNHPDIALCLGNLANSYSQLKDHQMAQRLFREALQIYQSEYGTVHPDVARIYVNQAIDNFIQHQDPEQAVYYLDSCLLALDYETGPERSLEKVNEPFYLLYALQVAADFWSNAEDTPEHSGAFKAFDYLLQASEVIDYLRGQYETRGVKLGLAAEAHLVYDEAIQVALDLYHQTDDPDYLETAFNFSEKSKGVLLLEALNQSDVQQFTGVPEAALASIKALEQSISNLEKLRFIEVEKRQSKSRVIVDSLSVVIFNEKRQLTEEIEALRKSYPNYYQLRYEVATVPLKRVRNQLVRSDQTIVEYFLGDDQLQIFVVNREGIQVQRVDLPEDFDSTLFRFYGAILESQAVAMNKIQANYIQYMESAYQLYEWLIHPVKDLLKERLVIIPDGELNLLPFDALLSKRPDSLSFFKTHNYLLRDFDISYCYSTTLLQKMLQQKSKKQLLPYLGIAPSFSRNNSTGLLPLRFNREEIEGSKETLGGEIFIGSDATKQNFLENYQRFKILHLATHGKSNSDSGDYSFLAFTEKDEDALLYVKELYNLSTYAEMVVLSACETGIGELHQGEGVASIASGFSYAGAKSLVATLWSVNDGTTKDLIHLFLENIKQGDDKDTALRNAKLTFIQSNGHLQAHPFFWAPFIPVGNMEAISFRSPFTYVIWMVLGALITFLAYFWISIRIADRKLYQKNTVQVIP